MRRVVLIVLILAAVSAASWFGYQRFGGAKAAATPDYEVLPVTRGNITATVSATGAILPERQVNLSFQTAGTVARVHVQTGDRVKTGQLLAELDTRDLDLVLRQSQISLRTAQTQLAQVKASANASDLTAAQAALASAQAAYQQLLRGADTDQFAAARASVEQARVSLEQAQQAYDKIKDMPNAGMFPQALQLQQATIAYETAQAQYRVTTRAATESQLAASQAQIAQAQSSLDRLVRGPSKEQVDIAQAAVDQAQLALEQAQRRLDAARLTAPWDGVVTVVNLVEGGPSTSVQPPVQVADQSQYRLNVQVDEVDIANIAVDQPVAIELDALPNEKLAGYVAKVAPAATTDASGATSYQVTIRLNQNDGRVRSGMSATAEIVSSARKDVLLIPNRAVQFERETGKTFVEKQVGETTQRIEVRLGVRDEQQSEVRDGLTDGDQRGHPQSHQPRAAPADLWGVLTWAQMR